jgi:hypothetical protein
MGSFNVASPDCSGNPFENNAYFFLLLQNDQRKFLQWLRKKAVLRKIKAESR